jgi:hypothetical protein
MHIPEAIAIFQKYGVDVIDMPLNQMRKSRNVLMQRLHPDVGGSVEEAQEVNLAFAVLRNIPFLRPTPRPRQPIESQRPNEWAWAGHSGPKSPNFFISRSDFTDLNFIKKSMWELSDNSNEEWMILGYNGMSFTKTVTVYGSSNIFFYMAIAMIDYQTKGSIPSSCRAVFARSGSSHVLYLIYADGEYYDQNPCKFAPNTAASNRLNDPEFMQELRRLLEQVKNQNLGGHPDRRDSLVRPLDQVSTALPRAGCGSVELRQDSAVNVPDR